MKIAICVRDGIGTGGGAVVSNTAYEMAQLGHDVLLISDYPVNINGCKNVYMPIGEYIKGYNPRYKIMRILKQFIQIIFFSIWGSIVLKKYKKRGYVSIDHNLEAFGADLNVLHNVFSAQFKNDNRILRKKLIQCVNPIFIFRILREKIVLSSKNSKGVIAVAPQLLDEAQKIIQINAKRWFIPNGIDLIKFCPPSMIEKKELRRKFGINNNEFILIFIGHEYTRKRLDMLIMSLVNLDPKIHLWVVGGRFESQSKFEDLASKYNVEDRVKFLGSRSDTNLLLKASDAFALTSDYEAWPMVIMEAMATGIPVISTPVGCAPHIISHKKNGFIINDVKEIQVILSDLIKSSEKDIKKIGEEARKTVEEYSWSNIAKNYLRALEEITSNEK